MLIVLLLFLLGGNTYTLICEPWKSGQLLQVASKTQDVPFFNSKNWFHFSASCLLSSLTLQV